MLTNKIFNASALTILASVALCLLSNVRLLTIKSIFAYYQIYFCLLSNTALLAIKYIFIIKKQVKHIIKCGRTIYFT